MSIECLIKNKLAPSIALKKKWYPGASLFLILLFIVSRKAIFPFSLLWDPPRLLSMCSEYSRCVVSWDSGGVQHEKDSQ